MQSVNRRRSAPAFLALGCVGAFASSPALAVDNADEAAVDQQADAGQIIVNGRYNQDIISPKATAPLINTPRSVAIVSENVIKDTGSATLVEALRTVPGITFGAAEGGNPIGDRPFIRGFDSQGSTYVDGVRDTSAQSRETFAVEQIQVVRGSDSSLGGRGSAGGSLNIITKLPRDRDFASADLSYGTADYKRITADLNYRLTDSVAFRVAGMWHDQEVAGRDALWQKRWGVAPSLTIGMNAPTQLTLSWYHLDTDELPDSGLPYRYVCSTTVCNAPTGFTFSEPMVGDVTLATGATGHVDRDSFYGLKNRDFRESKTGQFTVRASHDFGGVTLRNTARYSHNSQAYIYTQPDDSQGNAFNSGQVWRRANTRYGYVDTLSNQIDLFGKFNTGGIEHSFSAGAELSWEKARRGTFNVTTRHFSSGTTNGPSCSPAQVATFDCTSLFNPNPSDPWVNHVDGNYAATGPITRTTPGQETQNNANTKAIYAFDSISIGQSLILNLGARYDDYRSKVALPLINGVTPTVSRDDGIFNWQAGLIFKPTANTSLYASYATSATPPNSLLGEGQEGNSFGTIAATTTPAQTAAAIAALRAAADAALKVERTKSYEIGAKADLFNSRLSLNVALFRTETKNARVTGPNNTVEYIGERLIKGVEFGFNGEILPKWSIFGGYTYMDAKIVDGGFTALTAAAVPGQAAKTVLVPSVNNGRQFPQTAKHSFSLWTNYEVLPKLNIGGGAFYMSRVFGGYADNRAATQNGAGVVTVSPATRIIARSVPSYWRFDARASYEFDERIGLSVNIQNLTNKTYFSQAFSNHYATMAAGRSAFATLSVKY
ncbi:TonB-dependent receptor [Sphingobium chlorophenolicum]|uniref:TonB-dependent siderophore receptor n=1 Tax=Sphingobium chlorophenolicum TaxID=46429 RepID=A0A081RFG5_SPHCR|nr:TonB-dependent receptor [Sphingobium chlorophenolicum]KEQ53938.1 TonB-dependent siderophore receptor precursor [Sphingobium chlorophenolicum]